MAILGAFTVFYLIIIVLRGGQKTPTGLTLNLCLGEAIGGWTHEGVPGSVNHLGLDHRPSTCQGGSQTSFQIQGLLCFVFIPLAVTDSSPASELGQYFHTEKHILVLLLRFSLPSFVLRATSQSVAWKQHKGNCCGEQFASDKAPGPGCLQTVRLMFAQS